MLHKPYIGKMKDNCMIYSNGTFYLYSMYTKDENTEEYKNVWLATSKDGVHFEDYGCVVEDFPDYVWAMKVYEGEDGFYMNSGSFNADGKQAVLKFWKSEDLFHWEYKPELDIESPDVDNPNIRLDCMNVVKKGGKYYGYATGQYGFFESDNGKDWKIYPSNIDYKPFPVYNRALGGFEVADCIEIDGTFYLLCGGFGHIGNKGYGVYIYKSKNPLGPFTPCLPFYCLNGTSDRWVNMWERCFKKDGKYLAHNYMYDGHSYEKGSVYLPPIKKVKKTENSLCLEWWECNNVLYGDIFARCDSLIAESKKEIVYEDEKNICIFSEMLNLPENKAVIEMKLTLEENSFTNYSKGGIYLAESENSGTAIIFDTYGKCEITCIKNGKLDSVQDKISFGSTAPYYLEGGKTYSIRILEKNGLFEIYVDDLYLQTFNNAHSTDSKSVPFVAVGAVSVRNLCKLNDIKIYNMNL